jgi:uncharacterized protein YbjT (DUF2867 family)
MARVLLAGATGHLGREVLQELKRRDYWVRALVRDPGKLEHIRNLADDIFIGDVTRPDTLQGLCDGIDFVVSPLGQSVSPKRRKNKASFQSVDYQGNKNLLDVAVKAAVKKFVYVSVFGHDLFRHLEYVKTHEDFVRDLQQSGLDCAVVRPTAYFSVFQELYLPSTTIGRALVLGDGEKRINPIHEADLAKVCVDAITSEEKAIDVGGPKAYTRREIAELAFAALRLKTKLMSVPLWLASLMGNAMRPFDKRMSAMFAFGIATAQVDCIAPVAGARTLEEFYAEVAAGFKGEA